MKSVWVEIISGDTDLTVVRIFKSRSAAHRTGAILALMDYAAAVKVIRHQLWIRCKGECELCGSYVTESSGQMHEKWKHRGKGGEISMDNSVFACPKSHKYEHRDRNPKFLKKRLTLESDSGTLPSDSSTPGHRDNEEKPHS